MMDKFSFPGPGIGYSMHNHSNFSDGASTLEEMCRAAKASGLTVFGMSDHWVEPAYEGTGTESWRMAHDRLDEYVETLQKLKRSLDDDNFTIKIGLSVDSLGIVASDVCDKIVDSHRVMDGYWED